MRILAKSTLRQFWQRHPDAEQPLLAWYREVERENWDTPAKVKEKYRSASFVGDRVVLIRFIGTHEQYDAVDVRGI
jgi:mRNA interferase HigB